MNILSEVIPKKVSHLVYKVQLFDRISIKTRWKATYRFKNNFMCIYNIMILTLLYRDLVGFFSIW